MIDDFKMSFRMIFLHSKKICRVLWHPEGSRVFLYDEVISQKVDGHGVDVT